MVKCPRSEYTAGNRRQRIQPGRSSAGGTKTTKDVGEAVRDYRNYTHPQKELSHGITLEPGDAQMLWEVANSITFGETIPEEGRSFHGRMTVPVSLPA